MASQATSILTVSRNETLQNIRALVLENAGYHVATALNDRDALSLMEAPNTFALVLLCHSVPEASRVMLVREMKMLNPNLPILMLYNGYDSTKAKVDGSLHNLDAPEALIDMIGFLTKRVDKKETLN
jgi:CheY-like chemotaxis protein